MKRSSYIMGLMLLFMLLGLNGCARLTMPKANQAVGQLRIGNDEAAWEMIEDELEDPASPLR